MSHDQNTPTIVKVLDEKAIESAGRVSQRDDRGGACTPPLMASALATDGATMSNFLLLGKLKNVVYEVLTCLQNPSNTYDVDDFISVAEECIKELKTLKVERRIESRRVNLSLRHGNASAVSPGRSAASPSNREATMPGDDGEEAARTPSAPRSYKAALLKQKKNSPPRPKAEDLTREDVEATRLASALRSEERQRQAEERRLDHLHEMKQKSEAAEARGQRVKARREEAEERNRRETQERQASGVRRAEELRQQTVDKAQRAQTRVDEVRFTNDLRHQTKVLTLERKMTAAEQNQEQLREERQRQSQERHDAMLAAAERRRAMSEERKERQRQKELQRQEQLKRVEEQKKASSETKQQKADEWERKVTQRHIDVEAESTALTRKSEERRLAHEKLVEEQKEKLRQKFEKQEQKQQEVKDRRDRETEARPSVLELMPKLSEEEEELTSQRVSKLTAASARQGKIYADNYQKECLLGTKELNRSKLRAAFSRLSGFIAVPSVPQCKQPLHDISGTELTEVDFEYMRYFNAYELIVKVIVEARKARELTVLQEVCELLQLLFMHPTEGKENAAYFIRSGNLLSLHHIIRDEVKVHKQRGSGQCALNTLLTVVGICYERICSESQKAIKLIAVRDQMLSEGEVIGIDTICLGVIAACADEADLEMTYSALCIINLQLGVVSKRKGEAKTGCLQAATTSLFTALQNLLTPSGQELREDTASFSPARSTVLFCIFNCLNVLARWQLNAFQALWRDTRSSKPHSETDSKQTTTAHSGNNGAQRGDSVASATSGRLSRMELFHVLNSFFAYFRGHSDECEVIAHAPPSAPLSTDAPSVSFDEALQFGVALSHFPPFPFNGRDGEVNSSALQTGHLRAAMHECILFLGYLCLDNEPLKEMLAWGKGRSLLGNLLSALPIAYFTSARHVFFPTLMIALYENRRNVAIAAQEMDLTQLQAFVVEEYNGLSKKAKSYAQSHYEQLEAFKIESNPHFAVLKTAGNMSWADLDDDEPAKATASVASASSSPAIEKDSLCKGLKVSGISPANLYRFERRLPIAYWPGAAKQMETVAPPTA